MNKRDAITLKKGDLIYLGESICELTNLYLGEVTVIRVTGKGGILCHLSNQPWATAGIWVAYHHVRRWRRGLTPTPTPAQLRKRDMALVI